MSMRRVLLACALLLACDTTEAKDAADQAIDDGKKAIDASKKAIDDGKDLAKKAGDKAGQVKQGAQALGDKADGLAQDAGKLWADVPDTGALSKTAKGWLDQAAEHGEGGIAPLLAKGEQVAPVAADISRSLAGAIETDTKVEPIYQKVPEGQEAQVDAAISDMPRVEVIDGLTVGFRQLDETSTEKMVKERGYLVTWREGEHLVGFVYRSKRTVDLNKVVAETPRILGLARRALPD